MTPRLTVGMCKFAVHASVIFIAPVNQIAFDRRLSRRLRRKRRRRRDAIYPGGTLERIALRQYGDARKWRALAKANPGLDPRRLAVGAPDRAAATVSACRERSYASFTSGGVASAASAASASERLAELCACEPRRRMETVRSAASFLPTTRSAGTLASECSRTL